MTVPMSEADWRDWDYRKRPILWQITDLSKRIEELVAELPSRPGFVTNAEAEIAEAIRCLREAEKAYLKKPVE